MIYLIKIVFFLLLNDFAFANESKKNEILFKINNKVFTNVDLEKRTEYVVLINNFSETEFSKSEKKEILYDYISSLIFYEYYTQNKIVYKKLKDEINSIYKKNSSSTVELNDEEIKNYKFNIRIDLIRNKIIEEKLNSKKNELLKDFDKIDLLYNYNLKNLIINENLIDNELIENIKDKKSFSNFKKYLEEKKIDFFYKEENINDNRIISKKIKKIIKDDLKIYTNNENGYLNIISIDKNLESYEGIFVQLINFNIKTPLKKEGLQCDKLNEIIDINKTVFKEYEYSKLNNNIKNNLKAINDFVIIKDNDSYNYIILCDLTYDEKILKNINFNKNVNSLVDKIQTNFLKKYKNEYKFSKIK